MTRVVLLFLSAVLVPAQTALRPDAEGFIRHWLVLAPLAIEGESGMAEIDRPFIPTEGTSRPAAGGSLEVRRSWYTWQPLETTDYYIDFLEGFGQVLGQYVAAYAVTYVTAAEAMDVTLAMGSNDQGKVWLNGVEVMKAADSRGLEKDASRAAVTLRKGQNVLVFKVVNETNNWQGCIRFLQGTTPVRDLTISLVPE